MGVAPRRTLGVFVRRRRGVLIVLGCLVAVEAGLHLAVRLGLVAQDEHRFLADTRYASYVQYVVPKDSEGRFYRVYGTATVPESRVLWLFGGLSDLVAGEHLSNEVISKFRARGEDWTVVDLTQPEYVLDQSRALFLEVLKHGRKPALAVFLAGIYDVTTERIGLPLRSDALADIFDARPGTGASFFMDLHATRFKTPVVLEHLVNLPFRLPKWDLDSKNLFGPRTMSSDPAGAIASHLEHNRRLIRTVCQEFGFSCRFILAGFGEEVRVGIGFPREDRIRLLGEAGERLRTTGHWVVMTGTAATDGHGVRLDPTRIADAIVADLGEP